MSIKTDKVVIQLDCNNADFPGMRMYLTGAAVNLYCVAGVQVKLEYILFKLQNTHLLLNDDIVCVFPLK